MRYLVLLSFIMVVLLAGCSPYSSGIGNVGVPELMIIVLLVLFFGAMSGRQTYLRVHYFEYKDVQLPSLIARVEGEQTIVHAYSMSQRMQFFVTNKRVLVFNKTLFGSQHYSRYFPIDTLLSANIGYRNPFGLLILAGIVILWSIIVTSNMSQYNRDSSVILGGIFVAGIFVALWYFLRSYTLSLKNNKSTFTVLSRSESDLRQTLNHIDSLRMK